MLELEDKNLRNSAIRNVLECDTSYMTDEYLISAMRIVAACGNKKSIVLGHLASGNSEYEKFFIDKYLELHYKKNYSITNKE